ncbi:AAA family ATPase [Actinoplanes solisilvae]|uniref:AAA family ATPase n=1 Tax=Actinoplanes solisilvae TaxID=2486853 RepID=UPI000FDCDD6A|nr:helix-turn-helix transcriptional regulator [Actinoplanes solisilvae]
MLVGREPELTRFRELLDEVGAGGHAVIVEGEAGIGKSTLVDAVVAMARDQGFHELRCTGVHSETTSGFAGLHELLQPLLDRVTALPPGQRQALEIALGQAVGPAPSPLLTGLAALGLLEEYGAEQPAVVVVEDAQWLDASSARTIAFVARRLSQARVLLIVTVRSGRGATIDPFTSSGLPTAALGPLAPEESERLLREQRPELDVPAQKLILKEAVGNPLALAELPQVIEDRAGPWLPMTRRLENAFLAGASGLPERSRRLLLVIAAAPESSLRELMRAATSADLSLDDLAAIEDAGFVTVTGDHVALRHPLVRSAVYGAASVAERTVTHRLLAAASIDPDRAAWHAAAATPLYDDTVALALEETAARAQARSALTEAVAAMRRAAALSASVADRTRRIATAAEVARQAGEVADSALLVREAWPQATDPETLTSLALTDSALGASAALPGHSTDELLDLVARLGGPDGQDHRAQRLRILATAATAHCIHGLPDDVRERLAQAIDAAAGDNGGLPALLGRVLLHPAEHAAQARTRMPGLLGDVRDYLAERGDHRPSRSQIIIGVGLMAQAVHDPAAALACWDLGVEHFHRAGAPGDEAWSLRERALIRIGMGRLRDGLADAELALRLSTDLGLRVTAADSAIAAARAHAWRGDNTAALEALRRAGELSGPTFIKARAHWSAGLVALNEHRDEDAWTALHGAQAMATTGLWSIADLTEAATRTGRTASVVPLLEEASRQAAAFGSPFLDNLVRRAWAQAEPDRAEDHFEAALATVPGNPSALEVARTRLAYGEWLRRRRRIVDTREQLSAALRVFEGAGATPWTRRATSELRAAGVAAGRSDKFARPGTADTLTAQELQIARMAASGMSNREIADQVYLSHRTVATHLYKAFPKLGISNRTQLRSALDASAG